MWQNCNQNNEISTMNQTIFLKYGGYVQVFNTIALKMVKVSKLVQRKLIPHRSIIGLGTFRKIKYFGDIPRQLLCIQGDPR